jgi:hypothetical protein
LIYILLSLFILIFSLSLFLPRSDRLVVYLCALVFLALFSGFREGVKPDWKNYDEFFHRAQTETVEIFDYKSHRKEPIYVAWNKFIGLFFNHSLPLFLSVSFFSVLLTFTFYYKLTSWYWLCVPIYVTFFYVMREMGAMRAGFSYAALMYGVLVLNKSKIRSIIFFLLAIGFHFTSALFILTLPIILSIKKAKYLFVILLTGIIAYISKFAELFLNLVANLFVDSTLAIKIKGYLASDHLTYSLGLFDVTNIKNMIISMGCIVFYQKIKRTHPEALWCITAYIMGTSARIAFSDFAVIAGRGYSVFATVEPLIIVIFLKATLGEKGKLTAYFLVSFYSFIQIYFTLTKYPLLDYGINL